MPYAVVADVRPTWPDLAQAFIAGAEWADANNAEIPPLRALLRQVVPLVTDRMEKRRAEGCEIDAEYWETWLATASLFLASPKTPATPTPGDEDRES